MDYDDGLVSCQADALVIRRYYFPLATSKRVPYSSIRSVRSCAAGRGRIWGTGDFIHWRNLDVRRPKKEVGLVIDTGHRVKPVITPDDPDEVIRALVAHGVGSVAHPK